MAKYYGLIGFSVMTEPKPGIHKETIVEKPYYGDEIKANRRLQSAEKVNDDIVLSNDISIVADPFAYNNFQSIRYATYLGQKWKVSNVQVAHPRLILSMGGLYNG